jgi:hypothetical protein
VGEQPRGGNMCAVGRSWVSLNAKVGPQCHARNEPRHRRTIFALNFAIWYSINSAWNLVRSSSCSRIARIRSALVDSIVPLVARRNSRLHSHRRFRVSNFAQTPPRELV